MTTLGIDYGRRKLGLALSAGHLASPFRVLRINNWQEAFEKLAKIAQKESIGKFVVGVSEGEMRKEQETFAQELRRIIELPVETWDETLTTKEAQILAREAGLPLKRRRELEDAYAACIMLQSYLEAHGSKKGS